MAKIVRRVLDHADFATVPLAIAGCLAIWPACDAAAPEILLGAVEVAAGVVGWIFVEYAVTTVRCTTGGSRACASRTWRTISIRPKRQAVRSTQA